MNLILQLQTFQSINKTIGLMLNWLLIISITMVSTALLMFASAYLATLQQTGQYYKKDRSDVLLLLNSFNIVYIFVTPFIFTSLKKHYTLLVNVSLVLIGVGCVGRYLCTTDYSVALFMSSLVAIGHIPIITAPYGLLDLFPDHQKGYAASIPLFVPTLGINFCILYGMQHIASQYAEVVSISQAKQYIDTLNLIIAIVGSISCLITFILIQILKKEIRKSNQLEYQAKDKGNNSQNWIKIIKNRFMGGKAEIIMICCWGTILGINWTYGGLFGVFLAQTGLTHKDIAFVGLCANLSSVIFSNLGNWISNILKLPNSLIIFVFNMAGFFASLYIQASTVIDGMPFQNKQSLIFWIIVLRAGFSSFVSLALISLNHCGSSVLVSSIFFYIANAMNLGANLIVDSFQNWISLAMMSAVIWVCIFLVFATQFSVKAESPVTESSKNALRQQEESSSMKIQLQNQERNKSSKKVPSNL